MVCVKGDMPHLSSQPPSLQILEREPPHRPTSKGVKSIFMGNLSIFKCWKLHIKKRENHKIYRVGQNKHLCTLEPQQPLDWVSPPKSPPFAFPMPTVTAVSPGHFGVKISPWAWSLQDPQPWFQAQRPASPSELGVVTSPSEAGLSPPPPDRRGRM